MKNNKSRFIILSVIIPVYNTHRFLSRCFDSLVPSLNASKFKSEIVVVNDGSTDDSLSLIDDYKKLYPHLFKVVDQENGGLSAARNAGLKVASGKYIWFVDSDDLAESEGVSKILDVLSAESADYFTINAARVDEDNDICGQFTLSDRASAHPEQFDFSYQEMMGAFSQHMVWMRIYSREFIYGIEFPQGITHEDIHFDTKVLALKPTIFHTSILGYRHYFDNPDSITNNMSVKKVRSILWVYKDIYKWVASRNDEQVLNVYRLVMFVSMLRTQSYIFSLHFGIRDKLLLANEFQNAQKDLGVDIKLPNTIYRRERVYAQLLKSGLNKLALLFIMITS